MKEQEVKSRPIREDNLRSVLDDLYTIKYQEGREQFFESREEPGYRAIGALSYGPIGRTSEGAIMEREVELGVWDPEIKSSEEFLEKAYTKEREHFFKQSYEDPSVDPAIGKLSYEPVGGTASGAMKEKEEYLKGLGIL